MTQFKKSRELVVDTDKPWDDDVFGTLQGYAEFLTNALVADPGPFVLNVNGAWGSGKTFFVQRWAADLRNQGYPVVEFNAWENDAADDPLAPLMACFLDAQKEIISEDSVKQFKQTCGKYILAGGGLIVRAGLKQLVGEKGVDGIKDLLSDDAEGDLIELAGKQIDEQIAKQKAADNLQGLLKDFALKVEEVDRLELLVFIFIDELDRCRPTFAIELLERVKHLFNVDGIKFIVSTDSEQLVHSINGTYGTNFDGTTYLRRFFDETFRLPQADCEQFAKMLFSQLEGNNWLNCFADGDNPRVIFEEHAVAFSLSLRDQLQLFHRISAVLANLDRSRSVLLTPICFLCALRMKRPKEYSRLSNLTQGTDNWNKVRADLKFPGKSSALYIMDALFQYLSMTFQEARSHWQSSDKDHLLDRTEEGWKIDGSRQVVLNHYNDIKLYPKLIELAATMSN